jgi:MYXO-CTERM domain-containing protein
VIWNWSTNESTYPALKKAAFASNGGHGWLTESARASSAYELTNNLLQVAQIMPLQSGYGDAMGAGAVEEAQADVDKLTGNLNQTSLWISRLHAELPRAALGNDLEVGAAMKQTEVTNFIETTVGIGTPPPCPDYSGCGNNNTGGNNSVGSGVPSGSGGGSSGGSSGCGISLGGSGDASTAMGGLGVLVALSMLRRRRQR